MSYLTIRMLCQHGSFSLHIRMSCGLGLASRPATQQGPLATQASEQQVHLQPLSAEHHQCLSAAKRKMPAKWSSHHREVCPEHRDLHHKQAASQPAAAKPPCARPKRVGANCCPCHLSRGVLTLVRVPLIEQVHSAFAPCTRASIACSCMPMACP